MSQTARLLEDVTACDKKMTDRKNGHRHWLICKHQALCEISMTLRFCTVSRWFSWGANCLHTTNWTDRFTLKLMLRYACVWFPHKKLTFLFAVDFSSPIVAVSDDTTTKRPNYQMSRPQRWSTYESRLQNVDLRNVLLPNVGLPTQPLLITV